jgi:shikimate kinase
VKIFLIGFMGAGKTYLGKQLARKLNIPFIDTDEWIENRQGQNIAGIFSKEGEQAFRLMEHEAILKCCEMPSAVVSCGGGLPCYFNHMDLMRENGTVIYIQMDPDTLLTRLTRNEIKQRPLLSGKTEAELHDWILEKIREREPYYLKAHHIIGGNCLQPEDLMILLSHR